MFLFTPTKRQFLSTFCAHLLVASFGATAGWAAINFVDLQKHDSTFPSGALTLAQATRVMSLFFAGAAVGSIGFPFITEKFGSKRTIFALGFPQIISWLLIIFAQNPYYLYASRILSGSVAAGLMICLPLFITEICSDEIRGTLMAFFDPFRNSGALISFLLGKYFDYAGQAMYLMISTVAFVILFAGIPQSPAHLVNTEKQEAAKKSYIFFRGIVLGSSPVTKDEKHNPENANLTLSDFTNRRARKSFFLAISLVLLNLMQGFAIILTYITDIFETSNPNISSIDASMIITGMLIMANLVFVNLVDRAGRRTFYIYSSLATIIGHLAFAIYLKFLAENPSFDWVPVVAMSYVLFVSSIGMNAVPWMLMIEIFPKKIKNYGYGGCILLLLLLQFVLTELFPPIQERIGLIGWIIFFAAACLCNALFGMFVAPETRGKTHENIMKLLD